MKYFNIKCGVEQLAAREAHTLEVRGSSPLPAILLSLLIIFLTSCGAAKNLADPDDYGSKQALYKEEVDFTVYTEVGHKLVDVAVVGDFLSEYGIEKAKEKIRSDFFEYISCMHQDMIEVGNKLMDPAAYWADVYRKYKVVIVPETFKCFNDQHIVCHGFHSTNPKMIVLSWKRIATDEVLAMGPHEFSHLTGDYEHDHSNLTDELIKCIKYK